MIPEQVGRYEIKSELARGGMATVYYAHDPRFKRDVAVKVLPREFLHDVTFRARFEREAQTIAALEHPAIVPVYDFGEDGGQPYLVMRFMPGGSLAARLKHGPLSLADAARLLARLAPALDEAHAQGIVHRDLKPGNILFDLRGNPYVSDFGIAKLSEVGTAVTGTATIIGTPAYMSPEQARGEADLDGRSDIYALGAILYELLAGMPPYQAATPMGLVVKHLTEPVPRILTVRPYLPQDCETIIARAMAKDRAARYPTASDMAAAVEAVSRGEAIPSLPSPDERTVILEPEAEAPAPTRDSERRRRVLVWSWLVGGLAALSLLGACLARGLPAVALASATPTPTLTATAAGGTLTTAFTPASTSMSSATPTSVSEPDGGVDATPSWTPDRPAATSSPAVTRAASVTSPPSILNSTSTASPASPTPGTNPTASSPGTGSTPQRTATAAPTNTNTLPPPPTATPSPTNSAPAVAPTNTPPPTATRTPAPPTHTPPPTDTPTPADVQGPDIGNLNANPTLLVAGCDVAFSADISDPSGVASATVHWQSSNGKSGTAPMSGPSGGGTWSRTTTVSASALGTVTWFVTAQDSVGNGSQSGNGPNITTALSLTCP
jgi:serine/threonine-protein kinase